MVPSIKTNDASEVDSSNPHTAQASRQNQTSYPAQHLLSSVVEFSSIVLEFSSYLLPKANHNITPSAMFGGKSFTPEKDIGDLSGKVIFVTGGNTGLGQETILQLAKHHPTHIYLAARTESKAQQAIQEITTAVPDAPVSYIPLDLTSFESIASAAKTFTEQSPRLDILLNNAGIMATPMGHTKEGYEIQFGTNHMGHFLLTKLLLPTLQKTAAEPHADVRIVNVSSEGHQLAPSGLLVTDAAALETYSTWRRYGMSKLSNILHARELARRYPDITSVSVHPGIIKTGLYASFAQSNVLTRIAVGLMGSVGSLVLSDVPTGSKNQLWAATVDKKELKDGAYYTPVGHVKTGSRVEISDALATKLWEFSSEELVKKGY